MIVRGFVYFRTSQVFTYFTYSALWAATVARCRAWLLGFVLPLLGLWLGVLCSRRSQGNVRHGLDRPPCLLARRSMVVPLQRVLAGVAGDALGDAGRYTGLIEPRPARGPQGVEVYPSALGIKVG